MDRPNLITDGIGEPLRGDPSGAFGFESRKARDRTEDTEIDISVPSVAHSVGSVILV